MKFKRQRKEALAVNLTPLIDVVFLLLIFFMVSTSFTDLSELVVNLPEADGEQRQAETKGLELVITASEEMFLNGVPFPADEKNLRLILVEKQVLVAIFPYQSSPMPIRVMQWLLCRWTQ